MAIFDKITLLYFNHLYTNLNVAKTCKYIFEWLKLLLRGGGNLSLHFSFNIVSKHLQYLFELTCYMKQCQVIFSKFQWSSSSTKLQKWTHPTSSLVASFDNIQQLYRHNENDIHTQCYGNGLLVKYNKKVHIHQVSISIASKSRSFWIITRH